MREPMRKIGLFYTQMPRRYIDYVLVWESNPSSGTTTSCSGGVVDGKKDDEDEDKNVQKRKIFERNLEEEGLFLEREQLEGSGLNFVKIHSSMDVLRRYAEILRLRMPMKESLGEGEAELSILKMDGCNSSIKHHSKFGRCFNWMKKQFSYDEYKFPPLDHQRLNAIYARDKDYLFAVDENEIEFFTPGIRSSIIDFIIRRKRYSENPLDDFAFGIERLINMKVYCAAYPLHDGDLKSAGTSRNLLYEEWASLRNCLKSQPLDHIKEYFGVNIGLYFAWLGYYTRMLVPASILGLFCFIYGVGTLPNDEYSKTICTDETRIMCPLSETTKYWALNSTCIFSKFTYVFDNNSTVIFAVLMSFWAAIFLEFWKRYSASITHKWDLSSFDITEEQPRIGYLSRLKRLKKLDTDVLNINTEPQVSFWKTKVPFQLLSISSVLFLITLAVSTILGVIAYRVSMMKRFAGDSKSMFVSASAAGVNLIIIVFFNLIYTGIAEHLTELELHRTQTEFDDSLTLKIFTLQFVNYYSSIFYIAFFKGRFTTSPNTKPGFFDEERCAPAGCMSELCIQLSIIMVGKQFMGGILEMTLPLIQRWITHFKLLVSSKRRRTRRPAFTTQWAKDFKLGAWHSRSLFNEYLEMVIQYGFVTIFVAAFPLAPFFALVNNVLEMRLDATKMLLYNRRPVGQRVKSIGIWYNILDTMSKIAVISNALIIAFTSNFIPKFMHYVLRDDAKPFLDSSLVSFNISHFFNQTQNPNLSNAFSDEAEKNGICWYQGYEYNHTASDHKRYKRTSFFWQVSAARLIFVLVFQNIVSVCVMILKVIIPDVPKKLQKRIRHENHLTSEIIIKQEMLRARKESTNHPPPPPAATVVQQHVVIKENSPITHQKPSLPQLKSTKDEATSTTEDELNQMSSSSEKDLGKKEGEHYYRIKVRSKGKGKSGSLPKTPFDEEDSNSSDDGDPNNTSPAEV